MALTKSPVTNINTKKTTKNDAHVWDCELANKKTEQVYKVSSPCLDDHNFKKEELETIGDLSDVCSPFVLNAWHDLVDLTFFGP